MKVAHFTTSADGGAATLALRLHGALQNRGVQSSVYYRRGNLSGATRLEFVHDSVHDFAERAYRKWERALTRPGVNLFSRSTLPFKTRFNFRDLPDVIHLHWISQWLDLTSFLGNIPADIPLVWTIHDFGALTGGCHLYLGCNRFTDSCSPCPLLKPPFDRFTARAELRRKAAVLSSRRVCIVGNSRWTTGMARTARIFSETTTFETIYPSVDTTQFVPHDRITARRMLGIDPDVPLIGFGCADLGDKNKNIAEFFALLEATRASQAVEAILFGEGIPARQPDSIPIRNFGNISSPRLLSLVYSAMDLFVVTSDIETFGQTALEAQACGVPVCAWRVGGLGEAIEHGVTGLLSTWNDRREMLRHIDTLLRSPQLRAEFGRNGINRAATHFSTKAAADRYIAVYESIATHSRN